MQEQYNYKFLKFGNLDL